MKEVLAYLKENPTYYLATVNDGKPEVRPFGTAAEFEGKLYIQTGNIKPVFKQMEANPAIAICVQGSDGRWLRISATAVLDDRIEARQALLDQYPSLQSMYAADDGNCEVLYLKDATATFSSFTEEPKTITF